MQQLSKPDAERLGGDRAQNSEAGEVCDTPEVLSADVTNNCPAGNNTEAEESKSYNQAQRELGSVTAASGLVHGSDCVPEHQIADHSKIPIYDINNSAEAWRQSVQDVADEIEGFDPAIGVDAVLDSVKRLLKRLGSSTRNPDCLLYTSPSPRD